MENGKGPATKSDIQGLDRRMDGLDQKTERLDEKFDRMAIDQIKMRENMTTKEDFRTLHGDLERIGVLESGSA